MKEKKNREQRDSVQKQHQKKKNRIAYIFELCPGLLVEQEADFS